MSIPKPLTIAVSAGIAGQCGLDDVIGLVGIAAQQVRGADVLGRFVATVTCVSLWPLLLVVPAIVLQPTLVLAPARRPAERGVAGRRKNFWQGVEWADRRSTRR